MSSISQKILNEISEKIEQGWALIQNPCPLCHAPLVKHEKQGTYCANCGAFLITEEQAREKNLLKKQPKQDKAEKQEHNISQEALDNQNPRKMAETEFEQGWDENYFEERMAIVDQASSKIGAKLLQGWTLLADSCEQCGTPMMSQKDQPPICVMCESKPKPVVAAAQEQVHSKREPQTLRATPPSAKPEAEEISSFDKIIEEQKVETESALKIQTQRITLQPQPKQTQPQNIPQSVDVPMYMPPYQQVIQNSNSATNRSSLVNTLTRKREDLHKLLQMSNDVQGVLTICNTISAINSAIQTTSATTQTLSLYDISAHGTAAASEETTPIAQPGDKVPDVNVWIWNKEDKKEQISLSKYCEGVTILFTVPGAFTPTCTKKHLPAFVNAAKDFYAQGVTRIGCISVNDPFVMKEWGRSQNAHKVGIDMLADPEAELAKALGLCRKKGSPMGDRFYRSAFVVMNGIFYCIQVDEKGMKNTSPENIMKIFLEHLQPVKV